MAPPSCTAASPTRPNRWIPISHRWEEGQSIDKATADGKIDFDSHGIVTTPNDTLASA
jgi:hypothetical protein